MPENIIQVEPISPDAFAPFGQVIERSSAPPVFENPGLRSWRLDYRAIGDTELMVIEFSEIDMRFDRIERHHDVTQCFLPLSGRWMVMVVAPDSCAAAPDPETVRAFLVAPHQGILLARSVWHALNRFPIGGSAVYALLTSRETQAELEHQRAGGPTPRRTDVHDFADAGMAFRLAIPADLLPVAHDASHPSPR